MKRGGRRRRCLTRAELAVCCPGDRWGPRRTRVTECWGVLRAEELYTGLLVENASAVRPGSRGTATYNLEGRDVTAKWEIRQNAVWRRGRVFFACPRCGQRCTRLYLPLADSWLACHRCWGLTYNSRTIQNYKDSLWSRGVFARMFGTTHLRMRAYVLRKASDVSPAILEQMRATVRAKLACAEAARLRRLLPRVLGD
jgi:hypothetical protein